MCRRGLSLRCLYGEQSWFESQKRWAQGQCASWFLVCFLSFIMLFFSISCRYLKQLYNYLISANACYMIISINVKSGCHRRNFNTKVSRGEFLCLFFFCFYLHVCTHTENNPEKCASFPNDWSSLQTETSFSCVFPPSFAHFGFGESRETIWVLLKRQYRCLTEATVSSFIFFCFSFPSLMPV